MAGNTTPHTESGANRSFEDSDLEPGISTATVGRGADASLYEESEGAQTGTNRGAAHAPGEGLRHHGAVQPDTTLEGTLTTRAPGGSGQGISSHSQSEESEGQEKVVAERADAQAAINQAK